MAKGLGGMIAAIKQTEKAAAIKDGIACPVCGEPMKFNGCIWLCESDATIDLPDDLRLAIEAQGLNPWTYYIHDGAVEQLAAIIDPETGQVLAELRPSRDKGSFGGWCIDGTDAANAPATIREHGWTWHDWVPDSITERGG